MNYEHPNRKRKTAQRLIKIAVIIATIFFASIAFASTQNNTVATQSDNILQEELPSYSHEWTVTEVTEEVVTEEVENKVVAKVATTYSIPENEAKAFIYQHESGNVPCKINGGAVDCNYTGKRACGLGQALPCSKLTAVCKLEDVACQEIWWEGYMKSRYGTWENAYNFWIAHRWW